MKVSELEGTRLDLWVAKAAEIDDVRVEDWGCVSTPSPHNAFERIPFSPSTDWAQGGPIIQREKIRFADEDNGVVLAYIVTGKAVWGSTPLIAAMRCYVASKFGEEVAV